MDNHCLLHLYRTRVRACPRSRNSGTSSCTLSKSGHFFDKVPDKVVFGQVLVILILFAQFGLGSSRAATNATLVGWSETGLRETDGDDASIFVLSPPYSTIHAQLIANGILVRDPTGISVTYEAVADPNGSINTTSQGKGTFDQYAQALFNMPLQVDEGPAGFSMPGPTNVPQPMVFEPGQNQFSAYGIPLTPYDDAGAKNSFPLMRLVARDSASNLIASTQVVLPVSDGMDCRACHGSGARAAARPPQGWAWHTDSKKDYKLNILRSHDHHYLGTGLYSNVLNEVGYDQAGLIATAVADGLPVLCARCHPSEALPGTGASQMRPLTEVMHNDHAYVSDPDLGTSLTMMADSGACLRCHAVVREGEGEGVRP